MTQKAIELGDTQRTILGLLTNFGENKKKNSATAREGQRKAFERTQREKKNKYKREEDFPRALVKAAIARL